MLDRRNRDVTHHIDRVGHRQGIPVADEGAAVQRQRAGAQPVIVVEPQSAGVECHPARKAVWGNQQKDARALLMLRFPRLPNLHLLFHLSDSVCSIIPILLPSCLLKI